MRIFLSLLIVLSLCSCAAAPTHSEICNSFVGKDYYEINNELGRVLWNDFRGDYIFRAYKKGDCTTIIRIDRQNLITSWETKGKCD